MKKLVCLIASAVMIFSLSACATKETTPQPTETGTVSNTTETSKIIVGLDENFPPMGFRDDKNELVGFDIDLGKAAAKKMGVEIEFQPIDWDSKELELKSKKVDLLWNGVTITDERKQNMLFSKPYIKNNQIILVNPTSDIKTKADLAGKKIGLQKGSSARNAVDKDTETVKTIKEIVEYPDNISAFLDLSIGRTDAVVVDEIVAKYYLTQNPNKFVMLGDNFGGEEYGVAMRLDDTALNEKLQKALDEMNADGTSAEISKKWFNDDIMIK